MNPTAPLIEISVELEDAGWTSLLPHAVDLVEAAANAALAAAADADAEGEIVVLLTNDAEVRNLNARFRGKDAATNVLSFPAPANAVGALGDIALALGVCVREAADQGKTLTQHLQHLVAHGVLHLLGYDHEAEIEAEAMEAIERAVMASLGAPDPYAAERAVLRRGQWLTTTGRRPDAPQPASAAASGLRALWRRWRRTRRGRPMPTGTLSPRRKLDAPGLGHRRSPWPRSLPHLRWSTT